MTLDTVIALLTVVSMLATVVERGVELFRPLWVKVEAKSKDWANVAKLATAMLLGTGIAALLRIDIFAGIGVPQPPLYGYALAGILSSGGASMWHAILEWLKTIKVKDEPAPGVK